MNATSHSRHMNTRHHPFRRHTAALLSVSLAVMLLPQSAAAFPFVVRTESSGDDSGQGRMIAVQTDKSVPFELFCGGNYVLRKFQYGTADEQLPNFDFSPYTASYPVSWHVGHGDAGDVDGDGDMDLVRSTVMFYNFWSTFDNDSKYRLMVSLKGANSTWQAGWQRSINAEVTTLDAGSPVKLADLDRDGDLDLIECYTGIKVHWNPGDGNFGGTPKTIHAENTSYADLAVLDCDGDGWLDVVAAANSNPPRIVRLLSDNASSFSATTAYTAGTNATFEQLEVHDLDGDGREDVFFDVWLYLSGSSNISWLRNTGSGFDSPVPLATSSNGLVISSYALGDTDEDGKTDLVWQTAGYPDAKNGAVLLARRTGTTSFAVPMVLKDQILREFDPREIGGLCVADGDQDGDNDVYCDGGKFTLENTAIHPQAAFMLKGWAGTNPSGTVDLMVTDINGDGEDDLVAASGGGKKILWYAGGAATLSGPISVSTGNRVPTSVTSGDFNGDGYMDLAYTATNEVRRLYSFNGGGVTWSEGLLAQMSGAARATSADGDADGDMDVLVSSPSAGIVRWHRNNGDGTSWMLENVATGITGVQSLTVGQLIPGTRPEVVSVGMNAGKAAVRVHKYAAGWSYTMDSVNTEETSCVSLIANVMGDTIPDIIVAKGENQIVIQNAGINIATLNLPIHSLEALDWNRDGRTDILCAWAGGVVIYLNASANGTVWTPLYLASRESYQDAVAIDLNHDGLMDAAAANSSGELVLFTNISHALSYTQTALHPAGGAVKIAPGTEAPVISLGVTNHGREAIIGGRPDDTFVAPSSVVLRFYKAVASGSTWTAGAAMTAAEIQQAVESVNVDGVAVTAPAALSGSSLIITVPPAHLSSLATPAGGERSQGIHIRLKPSAANAGYSRFFVEHFADGLGLTTQWAVWDSGQPSQSRPVRADADAFWVRALVEIDGLTAIETWRKQHFGAPDGTGNRANDADYDRDGVPNLAEYAAGTDPKICEGALNAANGLFLFTPAAVTLPVQFRVRLNDAAMSDPKLKVTVQQSDNLNIWGTTAARTGGGSWTGIAPYSSIPGGGTTSHLFLTTYTPQMHPKLFFRLKVEELP
jgi:hypothetical protein